MNRALQLLGKVARIQRSSCNGFMDGLDSKYVAIRVILVQSGLSGLCLCCTCILSPLSALYMLPGCLVTLLANVTMIQLAYRIKQSRSGLLKMFSGKYIAFIAMFSLTAYTLPHIFPQALYGVVLAQLAYICACHLETGKTWH